MVRWAIFFPELFCAAFCCMMTGTPYVQFAVCTGLHQIFAIYRAMKISLTFVHEFLQFLHREAGKCGV